MLCTNILNLELRWLWKCHSGIYDYLCCPSCSLPVEFRVPFLYDSCSAVVTDSDVLNSKYVRWWGGGRCWAAFYCIRLGHRLNSEEWASTTASWLRRSPWVMAENANRDGCPPNAGKFSCENGLWQEHENAGGKAMVLYVTSEMNFLLLCSHARFRAWVLISYS